MARRASRRQVRSSARLLLPAAATTTQVYVPEAPRRRSAADDEFSVARTRILLVEASVAATKVGMDHRRLGLWRADVRSADSAPRLAELLVRFLDQCTLGAFPTADQHNAAEDAKVSLRRGPLAMSTGAVCDEELHSAVDELYEACMDSQAASARIEYGCPLLELASCLASPRRSASTALARDARSLT